MMFHVTKILLFLSTFSVAENTTNTEMGMLEDATNFYHDFARKVAKVDKLLNAECLKQVLNIAQLLRDGEVPFWLLKMIDASAKLEPGILEGNLYNLGSYSECLSVANVSNGIETKGMYCLEQIHLNVLTNGSQKITTYFYDDTPLFWAICVPDKCSSVDVAFLANISKFNLRNDHPLIDFNAAKCRTAETDYEPLDKAEIGYISFLSVILFLMVASSIYDYCASETAKRRELLSSFSIITNGKKLFSTKSGSDQLQCLSGIRALSMMWVILGHVFLFFSAGPASNLLDFKYFLDDPWTMYIRGATVSVDSFFLLGGVVMIYVYMKNMHKEQKNFNIFFYYLHRYLRLTPALAAVVFFDMTLISRVATGPVGFIATSKFAEPCKEYWWTTLLYIQNIVNPDYMCVNQSWYLAADMQMFLVSPLILLPLRRFKWMTFLGIILLCIGSMIFSFTNGYIYELRDSHLTVEQRKLYLKFYYYQPHTRATPWLIGCLIGFYIYERKIVKQQICIHKLLNLVLWAVSLALLLAVVFYDISKYPYHRLSMSLYLMLARPVWAVGLGWIVFSCAMGYGGLINKFLSLPIFQILAKLTYCLYLTHVSFISAIVVSQRDAPRLSTLSLSFEYWSLFMVLLLISTIWSLAFESPIIILEKNLLSRGKRNNPEPQPVEDCLPRRSTERNNMYFDNSALEDNFETQKNYNKRCYDVRQEIS